MREKILIYLLLVNVLALLLIGFDKRQARKSKSRISEFNFIILACFGGLAGIILGMFTFRHKTIKRSFHLKISLGFLVFITISYFIIQAVA